MIIKSQRESTLDDTVSRLVDSCEMCPFSNFFSDLKAQTCGVTCVTNNQVRRTTCAPVERRSASLHFGKFISSTEPRSVLSLWLGTSFSSGVKL